VPTPQEFARIEEHLGVLEAAMASGQPVQRLGNAEIDGRQEEKLDDLLFHV
jgi:hypothetical protein